ncbi:MAG: TetR/AcrR family transcriptional regulator [Lachnospiraceae bacterium]
MNSVIATEKKIFDSFLKLLEAKNFTSISVMDIVREAKISRSNFYLHFDSKYDVLEMLENQLIEGFLKIMIELRNAGRSKYYQSIEMQENLFFEEYFVYVKRHHHAFAILLKTSEQTGFSIRFARSIMKTRIETSKLWNKSAEVSTDLVYREEILSSIYISLIKTWLQRGMDLTEKQLAKMLIYHWRAVTSFKVNAQ